jgi:hypothetical protein
MSKRRAPDSVPQSGGAGRGAGPCRVLLQLPDSFDLTNADTFPMSKRRAPGEVRGADSDSASAVEREAPQAPDAPFLLYLR